MRISAQRRPGGRDQSRHRTGGKAGDGAVGRPRAPRSGGAEVRKSVPGASKTRTEILRFRVRRCASPRDDGCANTPQHRRARHLIAGANVAAAAQSRFIVSSVMSFIRLLASRKLPSRVTDVLRTMFPPPGIAQLWKFSVLGSKRTTVFGVDPDSLYQMMSLIAEMP